MSGKLAKSIVWGTTIAWVVLGVVSVLPAMFAPMMFDAPGSEKNIATIALALSLVSFPIVCGVAVIGSHLCLCSEAHALACSVACLPLINLALGGAGLWWISNVQGGRFAA